MENRVVAFLFISLSVAAILFQAIGFCAPAWMVVILQAGNPYPPTPPYDGFTDSTDSVNPMTLQYGLWFVSSCSKAFGLSMCQSTSIFEFQSQINMFAATGSSALVRGAGEEYFGMLTIQQVLATLGLLCCIAGTIMTIIFSCQSAEKATLSKGMTIYCSMALSGILLFAALGIQPLNQRHMQHLMEPLRKSVFGGAKMNFGFAWALLMSGIGVALSVIQAIMFTLFVCFKMNGGGPGNFIPLNRFNNAVI